MKINCHKVSFAAAVASALFYSMWSVAMYWWPTQSLNYMSAMYLLDSFGPLTEYFYMDGTLYVKGVLQSGIYTYIYVYIFCIIYNFLDKRR